MSHPHWTPLKSAIVVCGHAVYHGGPKLKPARLACSDENWFLLPFQKGEGRFFVSHIEAGVRLAADAMDSLLIFSGGQTRSPQILSEAQGYHDVASVFDFWGMNQVRSRVTTEEFSRDSFDNVLFSLARFRECVGHYPEKLTIISWAFKEQRFQFHTWSLYWPSSKYRFFGVGNPDNLEEAKIAAKCALEQFKKDLHGYDCADGGLGLKKQSRNPYRRQHGYFTSCPELAVVLAWRGPSRLPEKDIPWLKPQPLL